MDGNPNNEVLADIRASELYINHDAAFDPTNDIRIKDEVTKLIAKDWDKPKAVAVGLPCQACGLKMIKRPDAVCNHINGVCAPCTAILHVTNARLLQTTTAPSQSTT